MRGGRRKISRSWMTELLADLGLGMIWSFAGAGHLSRALRGEACPANGWGRWNQLSHCHPASRWRLNADFCLYDTNENEVRLFTVESKLSSRFLILGSLDFQQEERGEKLVNGLSFWGPFKDFSVCRTKEI